ncbi:tight adherence protein C [Chromohalobacter marismortui]|uniref:Tight adherence protein C n=1 Tax=Chromohalobacter marismortui TaxID=42055 RepID=A0A4R7NWB4_9GAMM|nr:MULTISPECIES: type II secretion system F family protein [Chromohalobacter]MCI0510313.1 type II secretion system F family protein [Chromohalobacter sp.]MCI0594008.1 type II secretion system F family protein [Chromohalobacter sp.]TDU25112.1 tight adherence protein C [Chromohalobacter marismortui]
MLAVMLLLASGAALMIAAGVCWVVAQRSLDRQPPQAPDAWRQTESWLLRRGSAWRVHRRRHARSAELAIVLRQAGFIGSRVQAQFLGILGTLAACACLVGTAWGWEQGRGVLGSLMLGIAASALTGVLCWAWLKHRRRRRTRLLDDEIALVLQVTRMLWEAGMTLESVLQGLIDNLRGTAPESVRELRSVTHKIDAGQAREDALEEVADVQASEGLSDLLKLLAQVSSSGGGARDSLRALSELLRDRRRTRLQEAVSRLSGKMSLVMMVFLFPALLIVLAGPAVLNLAGALATLGGE